MPVITVKHDYFDNIKFIAFGDDIEQTREEDALLIFYPQDDFFRAHYFVVQPMQGITKTFFDHIEKNAEFILKDTKAGLEPFLKSFYGETAEQRPTSNTNTGFYVDKKQQTRTIEFTRPTDKLKLDVNQPIAL